MGIVSKRPLKTMSNIVSVTLSPSHCGFVQRMEGNAKLTAGQRANTKSLQNAHPTQDINITSQTPKAQGTSQKRWQKECKSPRLGRTRMKKCLLDTTEPTHSQTHSNHGCLHKTGIRSSPSTLQHGEGSQTQTFTPSEELWMTGG